MGRILLFLLVHEQLVKFVISSDPPGKGGSLLNIKKMPNDFNHLGLTNNCKLFDVEFKRNNLLFCRTYLGNFSLIVRYLFFNFSFI